MPIYFCNCALNFPMLLISVLGKYSKYSEVPENEFNNWLSLVLEQDGLEPLTENQREEINRQFCTCLVSRAYFEVISCE